MNYFDEIERTLVGEIEALADPAPDETPEARAAAVEKAHAISELTNSFIKLQDTRLDEMRLRIEAVKVATKDEGYNYQKYLGIEEDSASKVKRLS